MKSITVMDTSPDWVIVALSSAVMDQPKPVRCDGADYVLFRNEAGDIRALVDQCAHRRAPLSLGRVVAGGLIECPYHGWRYDGSGACVAIPNLVEGKRVPRNYRVAAPQVTEMDGFIHLRTSLDGTESLGAVPENPADWDVFEVSREFELTMAYPADLLIDVILEKPSAFLKASGVRILDDLPFGDPTQTDDAIALEFAADRIARRKNGKVQADFPLRLALSVARNASLVDIAMTGDDSVPLARARLGVTAATPGLSIVHMRCMDGQYAGRSLTIDVRAHLDADLVRSIKPYASILRRQNAAT